MKQLVLGIDGGGTKTLGVLADQEQHILARCQVGPSNQNVVGTDGAARNLCDLIHRCCAEARCSPNDLGAIVFGLAGAGGDVERKRLKDAVNALAEKDGLKPLPITVENDARIALEGAFGGGSGIVVIAGTGSVVLGKTPKGDIVRVGGWGRILGDEGSGYFIGLEALKTITREMDGIASAGGLRERIAGKHGLDTREKIVMAVYQEKFEVPSLAPTVLEAAEAHDVVARGILQRAAAQLAEQIGAMVTALGVEGRIGLVMYGGLIDHETVYASVLRDEIRRLHSYIDIHPAMHPPVQGAVLLALKRLKES